ncbi:MAG: hypothetical protein ABI374_09270 [Ginsengibacter sp.]
MKYAIYFTVIICIAFASCKKEHSPVIPPETVDSVNSVLPKQVISSYTGTAATGDDSLITNVISIKYDTANLKIELYLDDTTNMNPYDKLIQTFTYNRDGYLTGYTTFDNGNISEKYSISRGSDNHIQTIIDDDIQGEQIDTTVFSYQATGTNTMVHTIMKSYQSAYNNFDTSIYTYDVDFKLIKIQGTNSGDQYVANYEYNANNTLSKVITVDEGNTLPTTLNAETDFFYSPSIPATNDDIVKKVFLGRDYYLSDIQLLYPFSYYTQVNLNNSFMVSFTNPYQVTKTQYLWNSSLDVKNYTYEMNDNKLISKVTWNDNNQPGYEIFKY